MFVIDTNVASELMRPEPTAAVADWYKYWIMVECSDVDLDAEDEVLNRARFYGAKTRTSCCFRKSTEFPGGSGTGTCGHCYAARTFPTMCEFD